MQPELLSQPSLWSTQSKACLGERFLSKHILGYRPPAFAHQDHSPGLGLRAGDELCSCWGSFTSFMAEDSMA